MKKYLLPLIVSTSLVAAPAAMSHSSTLSNTWTATGSVTSKMPTKAPNGAKIDPANAVAKAKDIDASIVKALDLVEDRFKYQNASLSRALEASSKNSSIAMRSQAEGLRNYVQHAVTKIEQKADATSKETKNNFNQAMEQVRQNHKKIDAMAGFMEKGLKELESQNKGQTAIALASASLSFDSLPKTISVAASVAYLDGGSAIAAGVGYSDPLGYRLSARVATDMKTFGISMGVGYSF